jgi:hypothetical protein
MPIGRILNIFLGACEQLTIYIHVATCGDRQLIVGATPTVEFLEGVDYSLVKSLDKMRHIDAYVSSLLQYAIAYHVIRNAYYSAFMYDVCSDFGPQYYFVAQCK